MAENDDERLDRLKASLSKAREGQGRTRRRASGGNAQAPTGDSGMSLGMRAGSEFDLGRHHRRRHRLGARPPARNQPGVPDRVFLPRGRGRGVERHPR